MTVERVPHVDPLAGANAATRLVRRALDVGPIRRLVIRIAPDLDRFFHWWTRGRFGHLVPMPFASMTSTGARSGQPRTTAVLYFNDGDDLILIASNWGGTRHPGWYHNLKAHPEAVLQRGGRSERYVAEELTDEGERERLFSVAHRVYPGYAQYRVRTAAIGRRIPIMRLHPAD
jgi:deazaflavin-dependent oxidoreductase (nitroreductase family)